MRYIIKIVICVILLPIISLTLTSCVGKKNSTLGVTTKEFVSQYNAKVQPSLQLPRILNRYDPMGDNIGIEQLDEYGHVHRYHFGCTIQQDVLVSLSINYSFKSEQNKQPTDDGLRKMEEMFLATINVVDQGRFTNAKEILKEMGLYDNKGKIQLSSGGECEKNGIHYSLQMGDGVFGTIIHPKEQK